MSGNPPLLKTNLWRRAIRMFLALGIAYGLFVLVAAVFQRRLIYFPRTIPPALAEPAAAELGFVPWRNPSGQIIGWKFPAASSPVASILIMHGNAGCAIDRGYLASPIHDAAPVDVYVLEYPGYGAREGSPDKRSLLAAADEAFGLLTNGLPKYLVSESIGAGVACHLAKAHPTKSPDWCFSCPITIWLPWPSEKCPCCRLICFCSTASILPNASRTIADR